MPKASATVLPMELRRTELLRKGKSNEEIDREIAAGLLSGKYRLPRRPAMSYMMSSGAGALQRRWTATSGSWQPHLMIFYPHLTSADLGLGGTPSTEAALVVDEGKAHLQHHGRGRRASPTASDRLPAGDRRPVATRRRGPGTGRRGDGEG